MNRIKHVVSAATVALGLALAPAAMAAGHGGGGFGGGHFSGFGGHIGGFGGHISGGFGGEHATGSVGPALGGHSFDGRHLAAGRGFAGGGHELGGFAGGRHDLGSGITLDGRLMYGRVPRFDHRGVFLGYDYPTLQVCNQYPGFYNPAVGCYGLEPLG